MTKLILECPIKHQSHFAALVPMHRHLAPWGHVKKLALCLVINLHLRLIDPAG